MLCLVPTSLVKPTFADLNKIGSCTKAAYPSKDKQTHSEDKLLPQVDTRKKYNNNKEYKGKQYDIFLFSYHSPCARCAETIVEAVKKMADDDQLNGFYISYQEIYGSLEETTDIFKKYNDAAANHHITLLPQYHPLK